MKNKFALVTVLLLIVVLVSLVVPACKTTQPVNMVFMSAEPGGSWYPLAVAMGEIWENDIPDVTVSHTPGGGVSNIESIAVDKAQLGLTHSFTAGYALSGLAPFEGPVTNFNALCSLTTEVILFTTYADSGIETLADLKGKRVAVTPKGWTTESIAQSLLGAVGLTYDDLDKVEFISGGEGSKLLQDGHLDAYLDGIDVVADPVMTEISLMRPIRILEITPEVFAALNTKGPGLYPWTVPAGTYKGVDADVSVVSARLGVVISPTLSEDLVYNMTKSLAEKWTSDMALVAESLANMAPQDLANPIGVDFHPGALKYYKEQGWIK